MSPEQEGPRDQAVVERARVALRVERAHRELRSLLDREFGGAEELAGTRALLETLPKLLHKHFEDEEAPEGLFEALRVIRPSIDSDLKSLRREHREILEAVEALEEGVRELDRVETPARRAEQVARIQQGAARLLRTVRRHEQVETRLTADILYTDEGGSG